MSDHSQRFRDLETNVIHAGAPHPPVEGAVITPIFQSANYMMRGEATYGAIRYLRLNNSPNHATLHARLATIEGAESALVTASGMAAISAALLAHAGSGDHLLVHKTLYGGTETFLDEDLSRLGISHTEFDATDPRGAEAWEHLVEDNTKVLYVEAISNPLMDVANLEAVVELGRAKGLVTIIDATFATPFNCRPIELGFDLVCHSATKYLNGHSDLVAGVVAGSAERIEKIVHLMNHLGGTLDTHACFLFERGLKTLALRVERQNANALQLARFLEGRSEVRKVLYPGLESHPQHEIARRLFTGFGGMMAFYAQDEATAQRFVERVRIPLHAASLGAIETLVVLPAQSSHLGLSEEERQKRGITGDLVRVSVGIESIAELVEDFAQALSGD